MEHYRKLERMYAVAPINGYFQPVLRIEKGFAEVIIEVRDEFHHTAGAMHGVVYFKAMDDAAFFAANSLVDDVFVLTARFELEFLRPVRNGQIRAVGRVTDDSNRRIHASAELFNCEGDLVGRGAGEFARSELALTAAVHYD
jgi:uncharacterized protein (TIGR00369 family)